ncbi:hypothetical protein SCAR479_13097 [Seiridium cardinale]|uniref:Uncharacterized protein n=1 Tax=Seiridium cardinale TaxID=138064 RepID=A0ABR2X8W6_9PEZI
MGLLGFFSRKPAPATESSGLLKAQPYNATVASLPPIRGTVPVAGNGPNILETLQKTHPRFKNTQDISFGEHSPAPPPAVSRLQDGNTGRPRTAPSQDRQAWSARRRSGSLKNHPVPKVPAVPPKKQGPPYRLPDKEPGQAVRYTKPRPPYRLPDRAPDPVVPDKPLPLYTRGRSSSIHSSRSGPTGAHVDLLDAQAGFHPTDFRRRLQATGAREYGEDVADRNIGEGGTSLRSIEARTSYSSPYADSRPSSLVPAARGERDDQNDVKQNKRHSLNSSLRTKSLVSEAGAARTKKTRRPGEAEPHLPKARIRINEDGSEGVSGPTKSEWRKSLPSYLTTSRRKREQDELDEFPDALRVKSKAALGTTERDHSGTRALSKQRSQHSIRRGDDATAVVCDMNGVNDGVRGVFDSSREPLSKAAKDDRRKTMSHTSRSESSQIPSKRLSLQNLQALTTRMNSPKDDVFRIQPRTPTGEGHASRRDRGNTVGSQGFSGVTEFQMQAFRSPEKSSSERPIGYNRPGVEEFARSQSPLASSGRALTRIDSDEIPERSSSVRHWSMDSTSATSLSSNPFRPQSRNTANTSLDLSPFAKEANFSRDSLGAISYRTAAETRLQPPFPVTSMPSPPRSSYRPKQSTFNMDDYLSSDDDYDAPRHPRGEGEEHLLFKDTGFAFSGLGLPGLNGAIDADAPLFLPASPPRIPPKSPRRKKSAEYNDMLLEKYRQLLAEPKQASRRHLARQKIAAYQYEDSDSDSSDEDRLQELDEDSADELSFDIPLTRRWTPAQPYRPKKYASREQVIQEERDITPADIMTAMRLRKEEKRRKRLSGASGSTIRAYSNSGKGKDVPRLQKYDVAGFDADVE